MSILVKKNKHSALVGINGYAIGIVVGTMKIDGVSVYLGLVKEQRVIGLIIWPITICLCLKRIK